jgi:iron complex outermembrane receptor protein
MRGRGDDSAVSIAFWAILGAMMVVGSCFPAADAARAASEEPVYSIGDVVVTATRTERSLEDVPASVTVITRDEIEKMPAQSADELLRNVAGVYVKHAVGLNTAGTYNMVYMRGLGGTSEARVLVLQDGVPINDSQTGAVEWNEIPIQDIERIEVVRGPGSALYGSNAMGGVINIITRKPDKEFKTVVEGGYGSLETYKVSLRNSASFGKFGYSVSGSRMDSGGYCESPPESRTSTTDDKAESAKNNIGGKLTYDIDPTSSVSFTGSYYHYDKTGKYTLIPDFNLYAQDALRGMLNYKKKWDALDLQMTVFGTDHDSSYDSAKSPAYKALDYTSDADYDDFGANLQTGFALGQHNYLTVGGDFKRGTLDSNYDYKSTVRTKTSGGKQDVISGYAQDELNFFDQKLILTLGARYDWWHSLDGYSNDTSAKNETFEDRTDSAVNPKAAAIFHATDHISLRAAVGRAFRSPDLNNIYRGDWTYGTVTYRGNPDLGPEDLVSYEAGIDVQATKNFSLKTTLYHTDAKDLIYIINTPTPNLKQYTNVGKVEIEGLEMEGELRVTPHLMFFSNITFDQSEIKEFEENRSLEGNYLTGTPKNKAVIGFVYDNPDILTLRVDGRYVGVIYDDDANKTEVGKYFTVDLEASRKITKNIEAILQISDLLDEEYQENSSSISPGRIVMGSLRISF